MSRVLLCLVIFLGGLVVLPGGASALTLRTADVHPADYPTVQAVKYMGQLLKDRSNGRLTLEIFHSSQLGDEKDSIEQCHAGGLDMVRVNLAPLIDRIPETGILALPYIFRSEEHLHKVLDDTYS